MERITRSMLLAGLLVVVFCSVGCQIVSVEDQAGKPIAWADVSTSTTAGSTSMFTAKTDLLGNATIGLSQEPPGTREYLEVSKEGYTSYRALRPTEGQVTVRLKKINKHGPRVVGPKVSPFRVSPSNAEKKK
ncbi:MAG: hypothetical protein K8S55_08810 [Phycisphaerae bacterium]|nr:hypothetical protein [Phycisphaerae bacterium]